jgi:hypothetical protein
MNRTISILLLSLIVTIGATPIWGQKSVNPISLSGIWKFKIGDSSTWGQANFNDKDWDEIYAPARWEDHGYNGYDGYAWYRKNVFISSSFQNQKIVLVLGYIDDVDEVYFNGVKIGQTGTFPPNYQSAYNAFRKYIIPSKLISFGAPNVIAVRVYDSQSEGGIVNGDIKIESQGITIIPTIDLTGEWEISKGRNFTPSSSRKIIVPGAWENQGMNWYDGFATYRTTFDVLPSMVSQDLILMAGRIDDLDEVYINGKLIGKTGSFTDLYCDQHYNQFRNYPVPPNVIKSGKNEIIVKVYDHGGEGGIIEGPFGLVTLKSFRDYWKLKRK